MNKHIKKPKKIHIHPKHAKPYRKRHYGLLAISVIATLLLFAYVVQTRAKTDSGLQGARDFIEDTLNMDAVKEQAVNSSYGFSFKYNPQMFYASAIDATTGDLVVGKDLGTARAYQTIRLSPTTINAQDSQSVLSVDYVAGTTVKDPVNLAAVEKQFVVDKAQTSNNTLTKLSSESVTLANHQFIKTQWQLQPKDALTNAITSEFTTYVSVLNGHPLVIKTNYSLTDPNLSNNFNAIIESLKLGPGSAQTSVQVSPAVASKTEASRTLLDSLLFTQIAQAASKDMSSQQISALYSPAVVKIFNVYCMDIQMEGKPYLSDVCRGTTGSGFIVSSNGYVATNGHVVVATPKDIVISDAITQLSKGNSLAFNYLAKLSGLTGDDLDKGKNTAESLSIAIDKFNSIPNSKFKVSNAVSNLLVDLNDKQPNLNELAALTQARKEYPEQDSIRRAKLVAWDYSAVDGVTKFANSDVALLKLEGKNFPYVKLGTLSQAAQGSGLSILGYPSNAGNNNLVDANQSKATLTTGKVSAIKNATGSDKKLIETDTTIGHGNSGGPAFSDNGEVVGIATYTSDGSGSGDGVFNYIRNIQDLTDLAAHSDVKLGDTGSQTQSAWQQGVTFFNKAQYSRALKEFAKVKQLYPQHPTVADFSANAQQKVANGEDVREIPVIILIVAGIVALAGVAGAVLLIIRHHGKHQVYKVMNGKEVESHTPQASTPPVETPQDEQPSTSAPADPPKTDKPK